MRGIQVGDKTGKPYEKLTYAIFKFIHEQEEIPNLVVQHDVILQGRTTSHQTDVYWKLEVGGVQYEAVVQAKNWNKPIDGH